MDSLLITCTNEKQHAVIKFVWDENVRGVKINLRLSGQYDDSILASVHCKIPYIL